MSKVYTVFWVGGKRDGETIGTFDDEREAAEFAEHFFYEHEEAFDPVCGGVSICDELGNDVVF